MSALCSKALFHAINRDSRIHVYALRIPFFKFFSQISESPNPQSFTLGYLVNSCGLSQESAVSAAKHVRIDLKITKKTDSVLRFLEINGFPKTHIAKLISLRPEILRANVDKTLKPKIKQFQDMGLSGLKLADLITSNPSIFFRSLEHQILPRLEYIKSVVGTDENVIRAIKRDKRLLSGSLQPSIDLLREYNIPNSRIAKFAITYPGILTIKAELLKENVEKVRSLGFKPETGLFSKALQTMCSMSKSTWDLKMELLKGLKWSEEEIFSAFRRAPGFLSASEEKIKKGMDFYAKMLNWNASMMSKHPLFLMFSLQERVIPRLTVYQILKSKELVKKERDFVTMLRLSEKDFLEKYVTKYQDEVPDMLKTYKLRE